MDNAEISPTLTTSPHHTHTQVRPYFKDVRDGKLPKVLFPEYVEMPEYQNIQGALRRH